MLSASDSTQFTYLLKAKKKKIEGEKENIIKIKSVFLRLKLMNKFP